MAIANGSYEKPVIKTRYIELTRGGQLGRSQHSRKGKSGV